MFLLSSTIFEISQFVLYAFFLPPFRFYNGCVLRNCQMDRVGDVIIRVEGTFKNFQKSSKQMVLCHLPASSASQINTDHALAMLAKI